MCRSVPDWLRLWPETEAHALAARLADVDNPLGYYVFAAVKRLDKKRLLALNAHSGLKLDVDSMAQSVNIIALSRLVQRFVSTLLLE